MFLERILKCHGESVSGTSSLICSQRNVASSLESVFFCQERRLRFLSSVLSTSSSTSCCIFIRNLQFLFQVERTNFFQKFYTLIRFFRLQMQAKFLKRAKLFRLKSVNINNFNAISQLFSSNPQPIGFRGNLLVKRPKFFYCTYSLGITETS